ncbi:hypothetical protein [Streptomyces griseorubiginosus]|uniref:hypothetical protein n=1 Tax=Streptomyces griseorubiginosus TaxID=67304 RepID=UPI0036E30F01
MSRRKARKPRRSRPVGKVMVRIETAPDVSVQVTLPDVTADDYREAQERAQAGEYAAPAVWRLISALHAAVHPDGAAPLDRSLWGTADFLKALVYLGLVDEGEWSAADDAALAELLGSGEAVDDVR